MTGHIMWVKNESYVWSYSSYLWYKGGNTIGIFRIHTNVQALSFGSFTKNWLLFC